MSKSSLAYGRIINAVIFILLEMAALVMVHRNGELQKIWMSRMSHQMMSSIWKTTGKISYFLDYKKVNEKLSEENGRLRNELELLKARLTVGEENGMLSTMDVSPKFRYTPASVIKLSQNKQHNYFIIDKGRRQGISEDNGVITRDGIIGIITSVGEDNSYGLSFMNSSVKVSSRIGRDGAIGWMSWDGITTARAILHDIPCNSEIVPGDTVWTSGLSAIFPPDIPIGTCGEKKLRNGSVYDIKVDLFESYSALKFVVVTSNKEMDTIKQLERDVQ